MIELVPAASESFANITSEGKVYQMGSHFMAVGGYRQTFITSRNLKYKICLIQPARFGAGCYIEMALSYHQPHQHGFVGR